MLLKIMTKESGFEKQVLINTDQIVTVKPIQPDLVEITMTNEESFKVGMDLDRFHSSVHPPSRFQQA